MSNYVQSLHVNFAQFAAKKEGFFIRLKETVDILGLIRIKVFN